jgi:hypothetical protein
MASVVHACGAPPRGPKMTPTPVVAIILRAKNLCKKFPRI